MRRRWPQGALLSMWPSLLFPMLRVVLIGLGLHVIRRLYVAVAVVQSGEWDWLLLSVALFLTGFLVELVPKRTLRFQPDWLAFAIYLVVLGYAAVSATLWGQSQTLGFRIPYFASMISPWLPPIVTILFGNLLAKSLFGESGRRR